MVGTYESLQHISIVFEISLFEISVFEISVFGISVFEISVFDISQFIRISKFFNIYKDIIQEIRNKDMAYVFLVS